MPIQITPQLVTTIILQLIRYRDRVDAILGEKEATEKLPFVLPPMPDNSVPYVEEIIQYFNTEIGKVLLNLENLEDRYEHFLTNPVTVNVRDQDIIDTREELFRLYHNSTQFKPLSGVTNETDTKNNYRNGPDVGFRIAYYVVKSQRLSSNPAFVNLLLATTDTLLEIVGQNAGLFISHPRTRGIVESLLNEFAIDGDLEDQGFLLLFRRLLGSTVIAFGDNQRTVPNQTSLKVIYGALSQVRKTLGQSGDDLAASLISAEGFEQFLVAISSEVARDPAFLTRNDLARDVLSAMLTKISGEFPSLLKDSKALLGVVEAGLGAVANNTAAILDSRSDKEEPLLSSLLAAILREVGDHAEKDRLLASIANGQVISELYRTALTSIAATPLRFSGADETNRLATELVSGLAKLLAIEELNALRSPATLQLLAVESLQILSRYPRLLAGQNTFATNLLASVLQAGAVVMADGLERKDLLKLADQALVATLSNAGLLSLDTRLSEAILAAGRGIATAGLNNHVDANERMAILSAVLQSIIASPPVLSRLQEQKMVEPIVLVLLESLKVDGTGLMTGTRFVETASRLILLLSRRGQLFIDKKIGLPELKAFLAMTLKRLERELGRTIDGDVQPYLIERLTSASFDSPERLKQGADSLIDEILPSMIKDLGHLRFKG